MPRYLDIETWTRRQHFYFFADYDNPYFNVCVNVDVTALLDLTWSSNELSFFIAYHYLSIKTANEIEPFKYRLRKDKVLVHDQIHAGTIILLDDESFTFAYFDYHRSFETFHSQAKKTIEEIRTGDRELKDRSENDDLIHHSVLPWFSFTSISHARNWGRQDSIPKIAFGKYFKEGERIKMPVSVEVHHALMDGFHVAKYFERLENYFADPLQALGM